MQFRVYGTEEGTSRETDIVVEAATMGEADRVARSRGVTPRRIEVDEDPLGPGVGARREVARAGEKGVGLETHTEQEVWRGSPSQWTNFPWYVACLLIIPIPFAIWKTIVVACTSFTLTTQRLKKAKGVFNRTFDEIEIYRIKDSTIRQTLWERIVGVGTIELVTSDRTHPTLVLPSIRGFAEVQQMIRTQTEAARRSRGVREIDME